MGNRFLKPNNRYKKERNFSKSFVITKPDTLKNSVCRLLRVVQLHPQKIPKLVHLFPEQNGTLN